jgi:hypothetical protein
MRITGAVLGLSATLLVSGCGDGGGEAFTASGTISAIGTSKTQVLAADGAGAGDRCQGVGDFDGLSEGGEVVVLDADGTKVGVGELEEGTLDDETEQLGDLGFTSCTWSFEVSDVESGEGEIYTLQAGAFEETFKKSEAGDLEISFTKD